MYTYKVKVAKAKTIDKATAMEFTIETGVEPGAALVLWVAAAAALLVGLPLRLGFADPLGVALFVELLLELVLLLVADPPVVGNSFFSGQLRS
jgi:hypothetical protein